MKRRNFVLFSALGLTAVSIPTLSCSYGKVEYDPALAEPILLSTLWNTETIAGIGIGYREQSSGENSKRALVNHLYEGVERNPETLPSSINQKVIKDFEKDETVVIDGWVLSATEARQCALLSLT